MSVLIGLKLRSQYIFILRAGQNNFITVLQQLGSLQMISSLIEILLRFFKEITNL